MARVLALVYGAACYALFLYTFLMAAWFIWTMDELPASPRPWTEALLINLALLSIFALQHSIMARQGFKKLWTKIIPPPIERSTFVLATNVALLLMIHFWQPINVTVWTVQAEWLRMVLHGLFGIGLIIVLISTFLIDHFDLFGLRQVWLYFQGREYAGPRFKTPAIYRFVRHPLYLGFIISFWSAPTMTAGHLIFAFMATAYILVAIQLEERDLVSIHGEDYQVYRSGVSMLVPWPSKRAS